MNNNKQNPNNKDRLNQQIEEEKMMNNYQGQSRDQIFKDIFEKDQFIGIDDLLQIVESRGETMTQKNNIIKFTSSNTIGSYKPEAFTGMSSEQIQSEMRVRKVNEEAQKKAYNAHMYERLDQQIVLQIQEKFSSQLNKLVEKKFSFRFVDNQSKLFTVNMNSQDFEVLSFFGIMDPELSCYYTPHSLNKDNNFLNVYASYAYQKLKTFQILRNRRGISKNELDRIYTQAASMMDILCSTYDNKIPMQRTQIPKFLENFSQQERVKANFAKILVLMNKIFTNQGTMFSYQTILKLVDRLSGMDNTFQGKHYIFKDEILTNKWIDSKSGLDKSNAKTYNILVKTSELKDPNQVYETNLDADANVLMAEMEQIMKAQETEIQRVVLKRKEQSQKTQSEKQSYILEKKQNGVDSSTLQTIAVAITDTSVKVNSFKKIIDNYQNWLPETMNEGLIVDTEVKFSSGRGLIKVVSDFAGIKLEDERVEVVPESFRFAKVGEKTFPTVFLRGKKYYQIKDGKLYQFSEESEPRVKEMIGAGLEAVDEEAQGEEK